MGDLSSEGRGIEFGQPKGSFDSPPVEIRFRVDEAGLRGTVVYEGDTQTVYKQAGLPLVTETCDLRPPKGETSHSWSIRAENQKGDLVGYSEAASLTDPVDGGCKERLVRFVIDSEMDYPGTLPKEPPLRHPIAKFDNIN